MKNTSVYNNITSDYPVVPTIVGDGIGPEITPAMQQVVDAAVKKAYGGSKKIQRKEVAAGEKLIELTGNGLPQETLDAIEEAGIAIKGPMGTPKGGGHRSFNVALRKIFDLYACVRPVKHYEGVFTTTMNSVGTDLTIFRENTEDVYAGYDYQSDDPVALAIKKVMRENGQDIDLTSAIGVKPMSEHNSRRIAQAAIEYASKIGYERATIMHKGNIQKYTEGAFEKRSTDQAKIMLGDKFIDQDGMKLVGWKQPEGTMLIDSLIADNMFQQIIQKPGSFKAIIAPNLNGDYISDAAAAMVGGLGLAPGANINYETGRAIFEATHGTAPDIMGQNKANPISLILSAKMMLEHLGWTQAAALVEMTVAEQLKSLRYTGDLYNQIRERDKYAKLQPITGQLYTALDDSQKPLAKAVVLGTKEMTQEMVQRILLAA